MSTLTERLKQRGILTSASYAVWKPHTEKGKPGWLYPTFDEAGEPLAARRWKNANSKGSPKYLWLPRREDRPPDFTLPTYYMLPGALDAIAECGGVVHLVAGEVDLLTLRAAGWANALSWYGEGNVPVTLADDLRRFGVKYAVYYPDLDDAGMDGARKVWERLQDSSISVKFRRLPGEDGTGFDLNDLWQRCAFVPTNFLSALAQAPLIEFEAEGAVEDRLIKAEEDSQLPEVPAAHPGEREEVERRAWAEIASRLTRRGTKPGYYECPYGDHKPEGKDFLFDPATGKVGGCQGKHAAQSKRWRDLADFLGIDVSQIARDVAAEFRPPQEPPPAPDPAEHLSESAPQAAQKRADGPLRVASGKRAAEGLKRLVTGATTIDSMPVLAPYKPLLRFGGMLRLWERRKIILVIGASGTGKTAFLETCQDGQRRRGENIIVYGPEWTPQEYQMRLVAGWGGPKVEDQRLDQIFLKEEAMGIEDHSGARLSDAQRARVLKILDMAAHWPGDAYYIDSAPRRVSELLDTVSNTVDKVRGEGKDITTFYLDYVQKTPRSGDGWAEIEFIMGDLFHLGVSSDLIIVVASQTKKEDSRKLRQGTLLDESSAQQLSDQQANAVITLNPVYQNGSRLERGWIRVVKNSLGIAPAKMLVETFLYRHRWGDKEITDVEDDAFDTTPALYSNNSKDEPDDPAQLDLVGYWQK